MLNPKPLQPSAVPVQKIDVSVFKVPTADQPESDGTAVWSHTTMVLVEVSAGNQKGLGYTYASAAAAQVIREELIEVLKGQDAMDIPSIWHDMLVKIRNFGRPGLISMAIAAVDNALWDLKARLLGVSIIGLLGGARREVPIYGSGGFTSYSVDQLERQLGGWVEQGIREVKMKVGRHPSEDLERVRAARRAIGRDARLYVDANGAYNRKQALELAGKFAESGVCWFEEPVSSDDLEGLRLIRDRAPSCMEIAAGEYGYDAAYFQRMVVSRAVDVLQADGTRCCGVTGFLQAAAVCYANGIPLSAHTAPTLHAPLCCVANSARNLEYFFDHSRIERMIFDGVLEPEDGCLKPDLTRPGFGFELKRKEAGRFAA